MNEQSGGAEPVSVAIADDLLVASALVDSTTAQWQEALAPYQHLNAYLIGHAEEPDGTEVFVFQIPKEMAA